VTPIPGTTRDTIEEVLNLQGVPVLLVDTAGLAETADLVEQVGIEHTRRALRQADMAIVVCDGSTPPQQEDWDVAELVRDLRAVVVLNKSDLGSVEGYQALLPEAPHVILSALTGSGLERLEATLSQVVLREPAQQGEPLASNPRHRDLLRLALEDLQDMERDLAAGFPWDVLTIDLSEAISALGEITGEQASEELLETIFSRFCVGK